MMNSSASSNMPMILLVVCVCFAFSVVFFIVGVHGVGRGLKPKDKAALQWRNAQTEKLRPQVVGQSVEKATAIVQKALPMYQVQPLPLADNGELPPFEASVRTIELHYTPRDKIVRDIELN
jgi:hypothetical protein